MALTKVTYVDGTTVITAENLNDIQDEIIQNASDISGKQATLSFDATPTNGSSNPVTSDGIYDALATKQDTLTFDDSPTNGSSNPVKSGGVYSSISQLSSAITATQIINTNNGGDIATITDGADNKQIQSLVVNIEPVQDTSGGDPSPTNICPITGWTGANVYRTGVNVWDEEWRNGYYSNTGVFISNSNYIANKNPIPVLPSTSYYLTINLAPQSYGRDVFTYDANGNFIQKMSYYNDAAFTTPSNCYSINFNLGSAYGATYNNDISINYPSTDTSYHAYTGTTKTVTWTDEAGTVYGGTLDLISGVLTVTHGIVDLGSLNWYYLSSLTYFYTGLSAYGAKNTETPSVKLDNYCTIYKTVSYNGLADYRATYYQNSIRIMDSRYTDTTAFKNAMSGVMYCYELATAQTYQLTAQQLATLKGTNNIWADCGSIASVTYPADTKLYIDQAIATAIAAI